MSELYKNFIKKIMHMQKGCKGHVYVFYKQLGS